MPALTLEKLKQATRSFCKELSQQAISELYGATDGKAVGTYVEHNLRAYLSKRYEFAWGSSAQGIDFPGDDLQVDLKVTSKRQPQSSSPYRDASQKVYGLGYHLIVIVYDKSDDHEAEAAVLTIEHVIFIAKERTADYQTTFGITEIIRRNGNQDDIIAFLMERNLPLDDIGRQRLAERILEQPPSLGYLTISNALQWRLQYKRAITEANRIDGLEDLID